jgi:predicted RNA-binding Zn-ribbon protein involved in translation (DUF1610 family)
MGRTCPACGHERTPQEDEVYPDWQCPACGVVYWKAEAKQARQHLEARPETAPVPEHDPEPPIEASTHVLTRPVNAGQGLLIVTLSLAAGAHLYLFAKYGTVYPCEAAMLRAVEIQRAKMKEPTSSAEAAGRATGERMARKLLGPILEAKMRREHGTLGCYGVAFGLVNP